LSDIDPRGSVVRYVRIAVWAAIAWVLFLLAGAALWGGERLVERLGEAGWRVAAVTLAVFAASHLLRFVRWHAFLLIEGCRVPRRRSLSIFLAGLALLPTPAKAGVAVRSYLLLREGVPANVSLAAYFAERLTDFLGLLVLATLVVDLGAPGTRLLAAAAVGVAGIAVVLAAPRACRALPGLPGVPDRLRRTIGWLSLFFEHAADMLAGWRLPLFVAVGMLANAAIGLLLWHVVWPSAAEPTLAGSIGTIAVSHLSGSLSLLPGGMGGFELVLLGQLGHAGVDAATAVMALASVRFASLWGSVAIGMPLLIAGVGRSSSGEPSGSAIRDAARSGPERSP
jgi:uncharacterized membrane protein YbhN (UPF0104 family)